MNHPAPRSPPHAARPPASATATPLPALPALAAQPSASAVKTPLPRVAQAGVDQRVVDVWCTWLGELATNAEAALAAALAYRRLPPEARDRLLEALEEDAPRVSVPPIAVYAPLLSMETDGARRARILHAMGPTDRVVCDEKPRALYGLTADGTRVAALVLPLYLEFVQVLVCRYRRGESLVGVHHDPIVDPRTAPRPGDHLLGAELEAAPFEAVVDELAHVVVAEARAGRELPEALKTLADLFGPSGDYSA